MIGNAQISMARPGQEEVEMLFASLSGQSRTPRCPYLAAVSPTGCLVTNDGPDSLVSFAQTAVVPGPSSVAVCRGRSRLWVVFSRWRDVVVSLSPSSL